LRGFGERRRGSSMSVKYKDYYKVLGVPKSASQSEIKKAFRKLARENHPDRNKDNPKALQRFKEVSEANEVLSDPEKRKRYDAFGQQYQAGQNVPDLEE